MVELREAGSAWRPWRRPSPPRGSRRPGGRWAPATVLAVLRSVAHRAVILLGFAGMLRRSEVAALAVADVDESPEGLSVRVRHSKTDQAGEGAVVAILPGSFADTCPVRAVAAWRAAAGIVDGALFRPGRGACGARGATGTTRCAVAERRPLERPAMTS